MGKLQRARDAWIETFQSYGVEPSGGLLSESYRRDGYLWDRRYHVWRSPEDMAQDPITSGDRFGMMIDAAIDATFEAVCELTVPDRPTPPTEG